MNWMYKLGLVNVSLELGGETITIDVSPVQASILHLFTLKPRWSLSDIGQVGFFDDLVSILSRYDFVWRVGICLCLTSVIIVLRMITSSVVLS